MNWETLLNNEALRNFGAGALVGFTLGFTLKRVLKLFIFLLGLYILGLLVLHQQGVISLHPEKLAEWFNELFTSFTGFLRGLVAPLSSLAGFTIGFVAGLKM